jgi:hypothetical protein
MVHSDLYLHFFWQRENVVGTLAPTWLRSIAYWK